MYLEHFGLKEPPFRITPHTDFFFDGANRGATLDALVYAITHDEGIVKVSGEVGSGKTMLCRVLMERLPESVTIVYLANPSLSRDDILYAIADELQLEIPDNARTAVVMRALQEQLIQSYSEGRQVVVLIDEAHAMPTETLEEIRLLSNLESNHSKLLQLVLFGQPELNDILARSDMRQLKERITHNFGLEPLVRDDIASYLDFRMRTAGYRGPSVFSPAALKLIAQSSLGLTRRINIIADKSLLAAFSSGTHLIGSKEAKAAIRDCEFSDPKHLSATPGSPRRLHIVAIASVAALLGAGFIWQAMSGFGQQQAGGASTAAGGPLSIPPVPPAPTNPATAPAAESPGLGPTPNATPPQSPQADAGGIGPTAVAQAPSTVTTKIGPSLPPGLPADVATAANASKAAPKQPGDPYEKLGPLTREKLKSSRDSLEALANDRWFVQIFATDEQKHEEVETLLRRISSDGADMDKIRIYHSDLSGKPKYGVIYGDFPSRRAAAMAMRKLPKTMRALQPYPRQAIRLR